jgi:hypothetical protein
MIFLILCSMLSLPQSFTEKLETLHLSETPHVIVVSVSDQKMTLFKSGEVVAEYSISTARNGIGQKVNSYQTPLGLHRIKEKIGKDAPTGAIFESREFHGEIWTSSPDTSDEKTTGETKKDLITSRILWLEGMEPAFNSGTDTDGNIVDSYQRYIYIHGTNNEKDIGKPASSGCIRMMNADVVKFFDQVEQGDLVWIQE